MRSGLSIVGPPFGLCSMRSRQTIFGPLLRFFAAVALCIWIAAQALCFAHCYFGVSHGCSARPSCHGSTPTPAHHDSSASLACITLKSALVGSGAEALVQPDFHLLYTLAPLAPTLDVRA